MLSGEGLQELNAEKRIDQQVWITDLEGFKLVEIWQISFVVEQINFAIFLFACCLLVLFILLYAPLFCILSKPVSAIQRAILPPLSS